jgi:hypothetical protein
MEKWWKFIESVAPLISGYPGWAQGLFALTLALVATSLTVFLILLPSAKAKVEAKTSTPAFAVTRPQDGEFITARRFSIEGRGAEPAKDNVLTVRLLNPQSGEALAVPGTLSVNSDHTWRFDSVEPPAPGDYDLRVEAVFGGARYSQQLRIHSVPGTATPPPVAAPSAEPPTVTIEGPPSIRLGKTTYFTVLTRSAVRGVWSIGGFQNEPVEVSPLGPSHQIYVEPTQAERVGDEFTLVFTAYNAQGVAATATKRFRVVAE